MVEYYPQVIDNWVFLDDLITADDAICEEFESIEMLGKSFFEFADKYALLPPAPDITRDERRDLEEHCGYDLSHLETVTQDDYFGICSMLELAFRLKQLADRGNVTRGELLEVGISPSFLSQRHRNLNNDSSKSYWYAEFETEIKGRLYVRYLAELFSDQGLSWSEPLESQLVELFEDGHGLLSRNNNAGIFIEDGKFFVRLTLHSGWRGPETESERCFDSLVVEALDVLFRFHLDEVDTLTKCGIQYQAARWGICALWLAYSNKFKNAKIRRCKACGRVLVVSGERGTRREYCSGRCSKWAQRNPGVKRKRELKIQR